MSMRSESAKLRQKLYIKQHLAELAILVGRPVVAGDLLSLEQTTFIGVAARKFEELETQAFSIPFSERMSEKFRNFVWRLHEANPSTVYVWVPRTLTCGLLEVPALTKIQFDFDFAVNDEGIVSFSTSDLADRMLLDFSNDSSGERRMKVEIQGVNWTRATY